MQAGEVARFGHDQHGAAVTRAAFAGGSLRGSRFP